LSGSSITFCFWLVSNPKTDVRHGQALTPEEFADQIKKESSDVQDSSLLSVM
jgi:hypothetical protein